jgi:hypothetical protein
VLRVLRPLLRRCLVVAAAVHSAEVHLSPAYQRRSRNATPHSEHARVASFRVCVAAIQSPIVKTLTSVLLPGTSSVPPRSVPPRYWFLVRGRIISVTYRSSSYSGRWRTFEDGRCSILSPNIQYCALAYKYVRRYRYANRLHFARGMLFI